RELMAEEHLLRGAALAEKLGDRIEEGIALRTLARIEAIRGNAAGLEAKLQTAIQTFERLNEVYELACTLAAWAEALLALPASVRMRTPLEPVADASKRAATLFRQLGVVPPAARCLLTLARHEAERE